MITAVDTNILIDIASADAEHGPSSRAALESCSLYGSLIVSSEVVAEFASGCVTAEQAIDIMKALRIEYIDIGENHAAKAGEVRGRKSGGARIIADYLIGMHAAVHAVQLLTRDAGFKRMNVPGLVVVTPAEVLERSA